MSRTKGPWTWNPGSRYVMAPSAAHEDGEPRYWRDIAEVRANDREEQEANLALIASAPDLLAAAERVLACMVSEPARVGEALGGALTALDEAARKARGEA